MDTIDFNGRALITAKQCATIAAVTPATWRGYASRGQAPEAVEQVGATQLWDLREVLEWNTGRFDATKRNDLRAKPGWLLRSETQTETDAFGGHHSATIWWIPEDATWTEPAFENMGWAILAFADEPPAHLHRSTVTGTVSLEAKRITLGGQVFEFSEVGGITELEPGTFWVEGQ